MTILVKGYVNRFRIQKGKPIKTIRTDRGNEYFNNELSTWIERNGIVHEKSTPYTPQHNSVAERFNRTSMESGRANLYGYSNLPMSLWAEALNCSTYVLNRVISRTAIEKKTPYEIWTGEKPDVSHLRVFGSDAYVHVPSAQRKKLDAKCIKCIFVGYCDNTKGYRLWDRKTNTIRISRDVFFNKESSNLDDESHQEIHEPKNVYR